MANGDRNFELIRAGSLVNKWDDVVPPPIGKTLMIGLGGTGKEVLLRFRRLLVEKFGTLGRLPCVQFIQIDTDTTENALHQYDIPANDDALYNKIRFQPMERIDLTIQGGCSKYLQNIRAYPHIAEWFQTKGRIKDLGDMGEGAAQIRMASRLGFYENYPDIENAIRHAERRLNSERNRDIMSESGFQFDPSLMNIYVVASLAGGTGSGTFLDMGFLLKDLFPEGSATRISVLFLPSFFSGYSGKTRMYANGYAALKELNHYSFGNWFMGNWSGKDVKSISPPPYEYTYLLDGKNEAGEMIGTNSEEYSAYQMVAEILFQDFALGEFAGMKRAVRINLKNYIDNVSVHNTWDDDKQYLRIQENQGFIKGESFTTRFCSFGLSAIHYPTNRLHLACGCKLAQSILKRWRHATVDEPRNVLFTQILNSEDIQFVQGEVTLKGGGVIEATHVEDALLIYNPDSDTGERFENYIWGKAQEIRRLIEAKPKGEKAAVLGEEIDRWNMLMGTPDSDDPDEWGPDIRTIENNMKLYLKRLNNGLKKKAGELADNPKYGVAYTLALFQELKKILRNDFFQYIPYFEEYITYWDDNALYWLDRLERIEAEIHTHDSELLFRKADLKRDLELLVPSDREKDGILYNYYISRIKKQVCRRGKRICEFVDESLLGRDSSTGKGLLGDFHRLTGGLSGLIAKLEIRGRYYSRKEDFATIKNLYRKEDVDSWYAKWIGEEKEELVKLKEIGDQLLADIFHVTTISEALDYIQKTPPDIIEDELIEKCTDFFRRQPQDEQPSALQMLFDDNRVSSAERDNLISGSYARAKVWMHKTAAVNHVDFKIKPEQKPYFVGVDQSDPVRLNQFKELLEKKIKSGDTAPQYKNIGETNKHSIVFYHELAGATAFYPSSVAERGGLLQSYRDFIQNPNAASPENQEDVHTDKNRFQFMDIVPKDPTEIRRYNESIRAFVLARLLGVLRVDSVQEDDGSWTNHFSYEHEVDFDRYTINLGNELTAVDLLFQDTRNETQTHRRKLYEQAERIVEEIQKKRMLSVYLLLMEFYMYMVYPPKKDISAAGIRIQQYSPFYAALEKERSRVRTHLVPDDKEYKKVTTALEKLRKKPIGKEMTYQEYADALEPYTRKGGKFEVIGEGAVQTRKRYFLPVLVMDGKKLIPEFDKDFIDEREQAQKPKTMRVDEESRPQTRPCPACKKDIPIQAVFCKWCKKKIASNIQCIHCGENTPDDLNVCWNCGRIPREDEKIIKCPMCHSYEGNEDSFPCPICEWSPSGDNSSEENFTGQEESGRSEEEPPETDEKSRTETDGEEAFKNRDQRENHQEEPEQKMESDEFPSEDQGKQSENMENQGTMICPVCGARVPESGKCLQCGFES